MEYDEDRKRCPDCGSELVSGEDQFADAWICAKCNREVHWPPKRKTARGWKMNSDPEWLRKKAETEDGCCVSVGGSDLVRRKPEADAGGRKAECVECAFESTTEHEGVPLCEGCKNERIADDKAAARAEAERELESAVEAAAENMELWNRECQHDGAVLRLRTALAAWKAAK